MYVINKSQQLRCYKVFICFILVDLSYIFFHLKMKIGTY